MIKIVKGKWWIGFISNKIISFPICRVKYAFIDLKRHKTIRFNEVVDGISFLKTLKEIDDKKAILKELYDKKTNKNT